MKAMSQTMYLVVAAVVILLTAVIVLAIFIQGVTPAMDIASAGSLCQTQLATSCSAFGQNPPTWNVQNVRVKDSKGEITTTSCSVLITGCTCDANKKEITGACETKKF